MSNDYVKLKVRPIELKDANDFIRRVHRHHNPVVGHRFSVSVVDEELQVRGVAIAGRPVARLAGHPLDVLEITRLATDGTKNACSMLYAAVANAAKALGFAKVQTYTLESEPGTSLKASGWIRDSVSAGGAWRKTERPLDLFGYEERTGQPTEAKVKWVKYFGGK